MRISKTELAWREWFLGEGRFRGDPRNPERRAITGAPERIPPDWWRRLEAFLARRADYAEPGRKAPENVHPAGGGNVDPRLSLHFNVREFDCHDGRKVPAVAIPALRRLCKDILEPMRAKFGTAHVLSGYRPADYNARIGGAKYSQHIYELTPDCVAADLQFASGTPQEWGRYADTHLKVGGLGVYQTSGFTHFDNRPDRARWTG